MVFFLSPLTCSTARSMVFADSIANPTDVNATDTLRNPTHGTGAMQTDRFNQAIESKKKVLFIPASIRSHIIPTLYVADLLADEHDIYYAVTNQVLADIVS